VYVEKLMNKKKLRMS